ncbi:MULTISPECIES: SHOCT domain-containing protein [unclassified Streptomyces]|uniref:SHOCT domain-containing protein n=1 Tax=unclassified Streptomyces TaxID=2593676 RepID=UPI002E2E55AA|nr:SHOCT domain-containing protein [Streptomyces sp. NBC_01439]
MMFWFDHNVSGWGWLAMSASMILFWAPIITVAVLLIRALNRSPEHAHVPARPSPEQLLAERFARGDIDEEDYQRRLAALRSSGPATP